MSNHPLSILTNGSRVSFFLAAGRENGRFLLLILLVFCLVPIFGQPTLNPAPDRPEGEGEGPFERLIIRGANLIDGSGAPPRGPVDIIVEGNRIKRIVNVGVPNIPINESQRPTAG